MRAVSIRDHLVQLGHRERQQRQGHLDRAGRVELDVRGEHFRHDRERHWGQAHVVADDENQDGHRWQPTNTRHAVRIGRFVVKIGADYHVGHGDAQRGYQQQWLPSNFVHQEEDGEGNRELHHPQEDGGLAGVEAAPGLREDLLGVGRHGRAAAELLGAEHRQDDEQSIPVPSVIYQICPFALVHSLLGYQLFYVVYFLLDVFLHQEGLQVSLSFGAVSALDEVVRGVGLPEEGGGEQKGDDEIDPGEDFEGHVRSDGVLGQYSGLETGIKYNLK